MKMFLVAKVRTRDKGQSDWGQELHYDSKMMLVFVNICVFLASFFSLFNGTFVPFFLST